LSRCSKQLNRNALLSSSTAFVGASRAFSVSARRLGEGASDAALSQKIAEEIKYEKEAAEDSAEVPEFLKAFNAQGVWQINDTTGNDEVTLTRKFGNENIRLIFSIGDMQSTENDPEFSEDHEDVSDAAEHQEPAGAFPIRASLSITKSTGPGALNIDTVCQEGSFLVDNISFYKDAKLGTDLTAESDWQRRGLYIGPQFDTLDVGVQEEFERYLSERGVDESLALFIPEYAEYKEQKEYVQWLENVKGFVDN
jgi:complement component 1 Q subcomponent-binding protein